MQITFISIDRLVLTLIFLTIALALYVFLVRPRLRQRTEFKEFYDLADTRWACIFAWLKIRWDIATAAVIALTPILWNGALDAIIAISLVLADVMPALAGLDLSALLMPAWLETTIQIGGAVLPVIRSQMMTRKDDEP